MRIIGGAQRGTRLTDLGHGDTQARLRPTTDRVRESIFNLLINGGYAQFIQGAHVLDLFAGTGALALEALSRGAKTATMVDNGRIATTIMRRNIARCHQDAHARIMRTDCTQLPAHDTKPFNLIFCDPPYAKGLGQKALTRALAQGWISQDALILLEEGTETIPPQGFMASDTRRYGDTWVHIWRPA